MARVVVVGGGLGGTATAARLAKLGHHVVLTERSHRLGGAIGFLECDGYRWNTGPTSTTLPAVLRDLFRKSGRPLEREADLVPVEPMREHRFPDGSRVALPAGSRAAQHRAVEAGLGPGLGDQWLDFTAGLADSWNVLRLDSLERPYSPEHTGDHARRLLATRTSMHRLVRGALRDGRLREMALHPAVLAGQDPRKVPAWAAVTAYVEQNFGTWTFPEGMGHLAALLTKRLAERRVDVRLGTTATDIVVRDGRAAGVDTDQGLVEADLVVCAVEPRQLPSLAAKLPRTRPADPPSTTHLGLRGDLPQLPHEVVLHGDPLLVVRAHPTAPRGAAAWTVLKSGRHGEDVLVTLARRSLDVRAQVEVRVDRSPRDLVDAWGGSPYGVRWEGRGTLRDRLGTVTPLPGVYGAGASAAPGAGVPFVALGAALVAQAIGRA